MIAGFLNFLGLESKEEKPTQKDIGTSKTETSIEIIHANEDKTIEEEIKKDNKTIIKKVIKIRSIDGKMATKETNIKTIRI